MMATPKPKTRYFGAALLAGEAFVATATSESGFNVYTIPAVLGVCLAALLVVVALAMLLHRRTRPVGCGSGQPRVM